LELNGGTGLKLHILALSLAAFPLSVATDQTGACWCAASAEAAAAIMRRRHTQQQPK